MSGRPLGAHLVWMFWMSMWFMSCGVSRSEGHIQVQILNLNHEDTHDVTLRLGSGSTYEESFALQALDGDGVFFDGFLTGDYAVSATCRDASGQVIQMGHSAQIEILDDQVTEAWVVLVDIRMESCTPDDKDCASVPAWDVVVQCRDGEKWEPVKTCRADNHCLIGECVSGPPVVPVTDPVELLISVCDPGSGPFSSTITHPYLPLSPGTNQVLEGYDGSDFTTIEFNVLSRVETVAGVETRLVEVKEWDESRLIEVSTRHYAQAPDGTVCNFGDAVDQYEDDVVTGHAGTWMAGEDGALPGIKMPADPKVGMRFQQELAPGVALDRGEIVTMGKPVSIGNRTFDDTLEISETSPLDKGKSKKIYVHELGLVVDEDLKLVQ